MKSINAYTTWRMVFSFSWVIALAVVGDVYGGEYYVYQDLSGKLVISNNAPPPGSKILKRETLSEVTDQQIAESQVREDTAGFDNRLSSLENTIGELTKNLPVQSEVIDNSQQGYDDTTLLCRSARLNDTDDDLSNTSPMPHLLGNQLMVSINRTRHFGLSMVRASEEVS